MGVVVVVLMLFAAMVVPNLATQKASRERSEFYQALNRIAGNAREMAVADGRTTRLSLESGGRTLSIFQEDAEGEEIERQVVDVPEDIQTTSVQADGSDGGSEWSVKFYPDGTSDGGGIELSDAGRVRSLDVATDGRIQLIEGPLPEKSEDKWPAGDYEKRA